MNIVKRRWTLGMAACLCILTAHADKTDIEKEENLQKTISLSEKRMPLQDLAAKIRQQTKVSLTVAQDLEDEKVTLFVRERPAGEILQKVAELYGAAWEKGEKGYTLRSTTAMRALEKQQLDLEERIGRASMLRALQNLAEKAQQPFESYLQDQVDLDKHYWELSAKITQLQEEQPDGWGKQIVETSKEIQALMQRGAGNFSHTLTSYLVGKVVSGWTEAQWHSFWRGEPQIATTKPGSVFQMIPAESLSWYRLYRESETQRFQNVDAPPFSDYFGDREIALSQQNAKTITLSLIYEPHYRQCHLSLYVDQGNGSFGITSGITGHLFRDEEEERKLSESPCLLYWNKNSADYDQLQQKLKAWAKQKDYAITGNATNLDDWLEQLFEQSNANVIADSFRSASFFNHSASNPAMSLTQAWNRVSDDYLLIRHQNYWQLRRKEVPERLLRPLEAKVKEGKPLELNDYADLCVKLTAVQASHLGSDRDKFSFDTSPFYYHRALRLWGSLNNQQKSAAGNSLYFRHLNPAQKQQLVHLLAISIAQGEATELIAAIIEQSPEKEVVIKLTDMLEDARFGAYLNGTLINSRETIEELRNILDLQNAYQTIVLKPIQTRSWLLTVKLSDRNKTANLEEEKSDDWSGLNFVIKATQPDQKSDPRNAK